MTPFPETFPHKGEYRTWDRHGNPTGYAAEPQHPGQQPTRCPGDATAAECFWGGYD